MSNLARRLTSSAFLVAIVLAGLFWTPLWGFMIGMLLFIMPALNEFYIMASADGTPLNRRLGLALGFGYAVLLALAAFPGPFHLPVGVWEFQVLYGVLALGIIGLGQLMSGTERALSAMGLLLFGLIYIPGLVGHFVLLRAWDLERGAWLVFFAILVTKLSDAGAYLVGKSMGRRRFAPRISPNKTWEGVAGGLLGGGLAAIAARSVPGVELPVLAAAAIGVILGVFALAGDLVESLIKRSCGVKDSGALMPGLGGVLDVIDSLIFTGPVFFALMRYLR